MKKVTAIGSHFLRWETLPRMWNHGIVNIHRKTGDTKGAAAYEISV